MISMSTRVMITVGESDVVMSVSSVWWWKHGQYNDDDSEGRYCGDDRLGHAMMITVGAVL